MTEVTPIGWSDADQRAVREQLDRILQSGPFQQSRRRQRFLEYIVGETLAGRGDRIKGYNIAVEVFDRAKEFDGGVDPIVRVEAARLRDRLREYYEADGRDDHIRIELPKGSYAPQISISTAAKPDPSLRRLVSTAEDRQHQTTPDPSAPMNAQQAETIAEPIRAHGVGAVLGAGSQPSPLAKMNLKQLGMLAGTLLLIIAVSFWATNHRNVGPSLPDKPSVAVLPFDNIGDDPKWDRLADGMTEDIITDLSHFKDLVVIARNSTELYKGKPIDIRQIGRDLNVKYVLEGSIQSMGDQVRVNAQLIEAASGSHIWSERYDRPVDDLFVVQNEVAQRIAATLGGAIAEADLRLIRRKPPASLSAFDASLLASGSTWQHKVTKESLIEAESLYRKALQLDPQLASAYFGLAIVQSYLIDFGWAPSVEEARSKMMEAAERAVQLEPGDANTHYALGLAYTYRGKWDQALAEFDRAEALAPSDASLLINMAWVIPQFGESGRAMSLAERSLKLKPYYSDWANQGFRTVFFFGEQYEKSIKYQLLVKEPVALDYAFLAMAYAYLGRTDDAEAAAANVKKLDPTWIAERFLIDGGGWAEKEAELFVDGARRAGLPDCVPADKLKDMPNLWRAKSCDQRRAKLLETEAKLGQ